MNNHVRRPDVHQEEDVIPRRNVVLSAVLIIVLTILLMICSWILLKDSEAILRPSGVFPEKYLGPRHEVQGVQQGLFGSKGLGQSLVHEQREKLQRYEWVNKEQRIVSIPIDQAMNLVVEENQR